MGSEIFDPFFWGLGKLKNLGIGTVLQLQKGNQQCYSNDSFHSVLAYYLWCFYLPHFFQGFFCLFLVLKSCNGAQKVHSLSYNFKNIIKSSKNSQ